MRATIVALIAGAAGLLSVQAALGQDEKQVEAGEAVYNDYCQTCHGANLVNSGQTFDLRHRPTAPDYTISVSGGVLSGSPY